MRTRVVLLGTLISLSFLSVSFGTLSAAAVPTGDPIPTPLASGSSQVGFTVVPTSAPTSPPSGGGHGGSGGSGGGSSGGATPPTCVPTKKTPSLSGIPLSSGTHLRVTPGRVAQGQDVLVKGDGFLPGEKVVIALYPHPTKLGVFTVRTNGQIYASVTIPKRTQLGTHAILAIGFQDCRVGAGTLDVVSPSGSGSSMFPWIVWILAGSTVGIAGLGILLAFILGWLPLGAAAASATTTGTRVTP